MVYVLKTTKTLFCSFIFYAWLTLIKKLYLCKMKKFIFIVLFLSLSIIVVKAEDTIRRSTDKIKTGWNVGGLPLVSFDSDLGLQYGVAVNLFDYKDSSNYPNARQSLYFEWSRFTKGNGINRFYYDTKELIQGIRIFTDISYLTEQALYFYGFNGYDAVYNVDWETEGADDYISRMFYRYNRKLLRIYTDFQGTFYNQKFSWLLGLNFYDYATGRVDVDKLNKGKDVDDKIPDTATLYDHYVDWGVIKSTEKNGGIITYLKMGLSYDNRDHDKTPTKGLKADAIFSFAPAFMGMKDYTHGILGLTLQQYFPFFQQSLVLCYRVGYQQVVFGEVPFFLAPNITTTWLRRVTNEGLGGGTSLRGVKRNRVLGDGIGYGNAEIRWNFFKTQLLNQNFMFAVTSFFDAGLVVDDKPIDYDQLRIQAAADPNFNFDDYFRQEGDKLHTSAGVGFKIIMNRNFVISMDYGHAFNAQDGKSGFYMGMNYIF